MGTEYDYERECDEIDEIMATKEQQMTDEIEKYERWILQRDNDIIGTFDKRFEAIKYLILMLNQTLKDLKGQDSLKSEFDYNIDFKRLQIYKIKIRPAYLGL